MLTEVTDTTATLQLIQNLINGGLSIPTEGQQHVALEHLTISLAGCVSTKDELETVCDGLGLVYTESGITGLFNRLKWSRQEQKINALIQRLQNHKSSLNLILTIVQCSASTQLQDSVNNLCSLVEQALASNSTMAMRLADEAGDPSSVHTIKDGSESSGDDTNTIREGGKASTSQSEVPKTYSDEAARSFAFDQVLQQSWVYRKMPLILSDGHSESSNTTRSRRRIAASIFSAYSLADISNYSLFSLPILIQEIDNRTWYVQVGRSAVLEKTTAVVERKPPGPFELSVKSLHSRLYRIQMERVNTVEDLKRKICDHEWGIDPFSSTLFYTEQGRGFKLRDGMTLADQGVHRNGVIHVLLRYRAGGEIMGG